MIVVKTHVLWLHWACCVGFCQQYNSYVFLFWAYGLTAFMTTEDPNSKPPKGAS